MRGNFRPPEEWNKMADEYEEALSAYFTALEQTDKLPTVAGMQKACGIGNRKTMMNQLHRDTDVGIVLQKYYVRMVALWTENLPSKKRSTTGIIFYLKNLRNLGFSFRDDHNFVDDEEFDNNDIEEEIVTRESTKTNTKEK